MHDKNSLIIIIDLFNEKVLDGLTKNITEYISNEQHIKSICLSTYTYNPLSLRVQQVAVPKKVYDNGVRLFVNKNPLVKVKNDWQESTVSANPVDNRSNLTNITERSDQLIFGAGNALDIVYYCNSVNQCINTIYWAGCAWNRCVESRPVGYSEIINFYKNNMFKNKIEFRTNKNLLLTDIADDLSNKGDEILVMPTDLDIVDNWSVANDNTGDWVYNL